MKPAAFGYVRAETTDEALAALHEHGGEARILAGGQSLLPMLNMRLAKPAMLVDVMRIGALAAVSGVTGRVDGTTITGGTSLRSRLSSRLSLHPPVDLLCRYC